MPDPVTLHGYRYSVYTRAARLALLQKGVAHRSVEIDPFSNPPPSYLTLHPFGRVPSLTHGRFTIFETSAITRHIDRAFDGQPLQPTDLQAQTRIDQTIAIIDNYGDWPMVRQVFSHRVFRPSEGEMPDEFEITSGLTASAKVLSVLDQFATEGLILTGQKITLADCHLIPMIDYFQRAPEGHAALATYPALLQWWAKISAQPIATQTAPILIP